MMSMTGHGRGECAAHGLRAVVECFSVNRKQGEVSVATPRELAWVEPHVREDVLKRIARGKVQVSVAVERGAGTGASLIRESAARAFLREARALQKKLRLAGEITIQTVLSAPGVLVSTEAAERDALPAVRRALGLALDALLAMRAREGAHLARELSRVAARLATLVRGVRKIAPGVAARLGENLRRRLAAAQVAAEVLDPRLAAEIALLAERCDVTEEITRLESHLAQFREGLSAEGPVGRTLEFLVQEMGREWNTIGSKANDAGISRLVVAAKAELDRLREQLANIE